MDRLDELWEVQKRFSTKSVFPSKEEGTKDLVLGVMSELDELLREISWKVHRKEPKIIIRDNLLEEIIDLQKYIWSIAILWDFSIDDIYREFKRKSIVVEQRWKQEMSLDGISSSQVIAGIDIDGVLADYPASFFQFVESIGREVPKDIVHTADLTLDPKEYAYLKHLYREGGYKRSIPVVKGAKRFLDIIKKRGYAIVLLTSRPYKQYKRMFADTMEWLDKNKLYYDAIIFDEEKNIRLYREFGDRVKFFVEDELGKANEVAEIGIKTFLINRAYNIGKETNGVIRVNGFQEMLNKIGGK